MKDPLKISEVIQDHPDEWLLFEVLQSDEFNRPVQGCLLYHGKSREELHHVAMTQRVRWGYIVYTGDPVPPDIEFVLCTIPKPSPCKDPLFPPG